MWPLSERMDVKSIHFGFCTSVAVAYYRSHLTTALGAVKCLNANLTQAVIFVDMDISFGIFVRPKKADIQAQKYGDTQILCYTP